MIHGLGLKGRLSGRPSEWIFVAERQGRLIPPRREVGLALVGVRLLQNNTLNEILVFDLSLATGLYALTNYAGTVMGTRHCGISRSLLDVSDWAACTELDWNVCSCIREARSARLPRTQRAGVQWAMGPNPCTIGFRPTC